MTGNVEGGPSGVVEVEAGAGATELVVGLPGAPGASEIHDGRGYAFPMGDQPSAPLGSNPMTRPTTIGELKASGWTSRTVKEEIRANVIAKLAAGQPLIDGIVGYDDTVLPQLANALLAGHDVIVLGERGQAKTRIIRALTGLLDEWLPIVAGSEINDDPLAPVSRYARDLVAEFGDGTAISWVHRNQRYGEKLATPDTSIADLIGEVDPIRVAEGRYLSDELTLHYGLVPRTNRGIFAVNELPDLAERIQVGLLNALEERDVQVRGYQVRLPLDVMFVASANPEDYTSRGRLITPLKDRFGSQIRTHYPLDVSTELAIMDSESRTFGDHGRDGPHVAVAVPDYLREVIATVSHVARASSHVNQRSGVSVRLSVTNLEAVAANALRRGLQAGETIAVARIDDLSAMTATSSGKIEIETLDDGAQGAIFDNLVRAAVLAVFRDRVSPELTRAVTQAFDEGTVVDVGEDVPAVHLAHQVSTIPALIGPVEVLTDGDDSPPAVAAAVAFVLEGLHLSKRLNKDISERRAVYRAR
jgi:magnesium chelatase subunit I